MNRDLPPKVFFWGGGREVGERARAFGTACPLKNLFWLTGSGNLRMMKRDGLVLAIEDGELHDGSVFQQNLIGGLL